MCRRVFALVVVLVLAVVASARAQTPIIIGPQNVLGWDMPQATVAIAQGCSYRVSANGAPSTPLVGPVTCSAPVAPAVDPACTVNLLAQTAIPLNSGSITLTSTCSGVTSLPSAPFAYVVLVIPIPTNVRIR